MFAAKKQLRQELKRALAAMTRQQRQQESEILTSKVVLQQQRKNKTLPLSVQVLACEEFRNSRRVSVYLTMPTEVDTHGMLEVHTSPSGPLYCE